VRRLRPYSSLGASRPDLGNPLERFHILLHAASSLKSMAVMAVGYNAFKQCVCIILELAP